MAALGVVGPGGPGHALALTSVSDVTEVGVLSARHLAGDGRYYDPAGLPLRSARLHHWLIRAVFADEAAQTGLSCSEPSRACVPIPLPRRDSTRGMSGTPVGRMLPSPRHERLGSPIVSLTRLQDSRLVALRPARLLPPKRHLTPRSACRLSTTNRGLLLGSPAITQVGLTPTGLVQLQDAPWARAYDPWSVGDRSGAPHAPAQGVRSRASPATRRARCARRDPEAAPWWPCPTFPRGARGRSSPAAARPPP